jgi:hypothetical protein
MTVVKIGARIDGWIVVRIGGTIDKWIAEKIDAKIGNSTVEWTARQIASRGLIDLNGLSVQIGRSGLSARRGLSDQNDRAETRRAGDIRTGGSGGTQRRHLVWPVRVRGH